MSEQKHGGDILEEAAKTFSDRRAVYGENWRMVGPVFMELFPMGVSLNNADDFNRFHILMLQVVKLTRYAQSFDLGGHEDSMLDLSVYAAMQVAIDREINDPKRGEIPL